MYYLNGKSDVVVVDLETTGTDPAKHAVVKIAVAVCDPFFNVRRKKVFSLAPHAGAIVDAKALEVNGLTELEIFSYPSADKVLKELNSWLFANCKANPRFALWCAWGVGFDDKFLFKTYERASVEPYMRYTWLCLRGIATFLGLFSAHLRDEEKCETKGVARFLELLGEKFEGFEHEPLADVENSLRVVRILVERVFHAVQADTYVAALKATAAQNADKNAEIEEVPF